MPLEDIESAGKYITDLVVTNPESTDYPGQDGDNHLRGIKNVLKNSLPNITGPVTATQAELNLLDGKTTVATLEGNTFTDHQTIDAAGASLYIDSSSLNPATWFQDNGNNRSVIYWNRTSDTMSIRMYDTDNVTARAELSLTETGIINANVGVLQYGGTEVARDTWYGVSAKLSATKTGINGNLSPLTSANSNIAVEDDSFGWFNPTTGRFTPTKAGWYICTLNLVAGSITSALTALIVKNGTTNVGLVSGLESTFAYLFIARPVYFNGTTDFIDCRASTVDTSWTLDATTNMTITRVGA